MDPKVVAYLTKERVCALTTLLKNGTPHSSSLHYSHADNPLIIYVSTENTSRKCEALLDGTHGKASFVIGFSEQEWITLQMQGDIRIIKDATELAAAQAVHYAKIPNSAKFKDDPATVFLAFTPKWWRFTDYNTTPLTILNG